MIPNSELTNYQSQKENFIDQISLELFKKLKSKPDKAEWTKNYLAGDFSVIDNPVAKETFDQALSFESYEKFRDDIIAKTSLKYLYCLSVLNKLKLLPLTTKTLSSKSDEQATTDLKKIIGVDDKYDGICILHNTSGEINIGSQDSAQIFSLHSVGKVFTGILIIEMIAKNIIPKDEIKKIGIELDEDFIPFPKLN